MDAILPHEPDELGDDHGGVGVVNLHHRVLPEVPQGIALGGELLDHQLGGVADHKVLLVDPQQPARIVAVVRVEEEGQVVGNVFFVKVYAILYQGLVYGFQVEQVQPVGAALKAGDHHVVHHGLDRAPGEGHREAHIRLLRPALRVPFRGEPGVGLFVLLVLPKALAEQAEVIQQPYAVRGQVQGGGGVQVAGGQAAQPAVAQGGLGLALLNFGQGLPGLLQSGPGLFKKPQVDQVVGEKLSHQKLGGHVIELLISGNAGGLGQLFLGHGQKRPVDIRVFRLT